MNKSTLTIPGVGLQASRSTVQPRLVPTLPSTRLARSPKAVTSSASAQTYHTIQWLVDRDRRDRAYQAYAYFRWLDDALDQPDAGPADRVALTARQSHLIERAYQGERPAIERAEEGWLLDLIASDPDRTSGLAQYIRHLLAVMVFDTERRGRLISAVELNTYTRDLAVGVTEAMHYFIGHDRPAPRHADRYQAVIGAHITHMLRDTVDDASAGYFNIPREVLVAHAIAPQDVASAPYRAWVRERVQVARACFENGARNMSTVPCRRCKLAGFAYLSRFTQVLDLIERDDYRLRDSYPENLSVIDGFRLTARALQLALRPTPQSVPSLT